MENINKIRDIFVEYFNENLPLHIADTIRQILSNSRFCKTKDHPFQSTNWKVGRRKPNNGSSLDAILGPTHRYTLRLQGH